MKLSDKYISKKESVDFGNSKNKIVIDDNYYALAEIIENLTLELKQARLSK